MITIPKQLQNPAFRFHLVPKNTKIPMEKKWNSDNNYPFFHSRLDEHLKRKGNYGIVTGFGNLIVIDFDDLDYYNSMAHKMPPTFTVRSAGKRLPHLYYILTGSEMFKKYGVDAECNELNEFIEVTENSRSQILSNSSKHSIKRVCDIQAARSGVVGPGSSVNRRYYTIDVDVPIAEITLKTLQNLFNFNPQQRKEYTGDSKPSPEAVKKSQLVLKQLKVLRTTATHYKCPYHAMSGKGNLFIYPDGAIYCFHESKHWRDGNHFAEELRLMRGE